MQQAESTANMYSTGDDTMSKTQAQTPSTTATDAPETPTITAATRKLVDGIREPFRGFVGNMGLMLSSRAALAPKFVAAAKAWRKEMNGATFIAFVRELDPSVPMKQKEYANHAVYNAAIYLKRLVDAKERGAKEGEAAEHRGPAALPPLTGMARLLAAIKPLIPEDNLAKLWEVIASEMHWSDAQKEKLQHLVDESDPLIAMRTPKGQTAPVLHIIKPRHAKVDNVEVAA